MRGINMVCAIVLTEEEDWIVATDINSGISSQGKTNKEAMQNLKEALELYYEDIPEEERKVYPVMLTTLEVLV